LLKTLKPQIQFAESTGVSLFEELPQFTVGGGQRGKRRSFQDFGRLFQGLLRSV
jgi:hypothetical protein